MRRRASVSRFLVLSAILGCLCALAVTAGTALGHSLATVDCAPTAAGGNLCVLDASANTALNVSGTSHLTLAHDLVVNSNASTAASISDGSTVQAFAIGGPSAPAGFVAVGGATYTPAPVNSPAQPDPFAGASVTHGTCTGGSSVTATGAQTVSAGTYSTLGSASGGNLTLSPGTYTITGQLTATGTGNITGTGVTLFFCPGASISLTGSGTTTLSAPGGAADFVIFFDRTGTGGITTASNTVNLTGRVYDAGGKLSVGNLNVQGDVVVDLADIHSGGNVQIGGEPSCALTMVIPGPPKGIQVTVQDTVSGIATIHTSTVNANASVPAFTTNTTLPVVISATKVNQAASATLVVTVTNGAGLTTVCDPQLPRGAKTNWLRAALRHALAHTLTHALRP